VSTALESEAVTTAAEALPAELVLLLVNRLGLTREQIAAMTKAKAIERLNRYWTVGRLTPHLCSRRAAKPRMPKQGNCELVHGVTNSDDDHGSAVRGVGAPYGLRLLPVRRDSCLRHARRRPGRAGGKQAPSSRSRWIHRWSRCAWPAPPPPGRDLLGSTGSG
jgi:hypothetical protein